MPAQSYRGRLRSRVNPAVYGWASPEFTVRSAYTAAFNGGVFLFVAPKPCKLTRVDYVADTNGGGGTFVQLRKHVAGQTAAANAAVSGSNIVQLVTGDIPADSAVRVPVLNRPLITTANTEVFARGDKLAMLTPASWIGTVTCYFVWL